MNTDIKNIKRITPFVVDEVTYTHRVGGILYADSIAGARQGYVALKSLPDDFYQLLLSDVKSNGLLLLAENTNRTHFEHAGGAWIQDFENDGIRDQLRNGVIRIDGRSGASAHDGILVKIATKNASADIISVFLHESAHHYWFSVNNQLAQARGLTYGVANNLAHLIDPFYFRNRTINGLHLSRANFNHDYFMALTKHMSGLSIQSAFDIPRLGSIERPGAAYLIFRRPLEYFRDDLQASMEHLLKLKPGAYPHNMEALIRNTELRLYSNEKGAISNFIENLHDLHPQLPYTRIRAAITEANRTMRCELGAHFKQSLVLYPKDTVSLAAPIVQQYKQIAASNVEMMPPQVGNYQPQIFRTGFQYQTQYSKQGMAVRSVMPGFYNVVKEYVAEQARFPVPTSIGKFSTPFYPAIGQPIKIWDVTASAKSSLASAEFPRFNQCLPKIEVLDPRAWGWRSAISEGRRVHMLQRLNYPAWHSLASKGMSPVLQVVLGVMDYQHYRENMPTSTDSEALEYAVMRRIMGVFLDHVALTPEPSFDPILSKQCLDALTKIPVNINSNLSQIMSAEGAQLALSIREKAEAINKDVLGGRRSLLEVIAITDPEHCSSYAKSITTNPPKHPNPTAPWKVSSEEMQAYLSSLADHRRRIDNKVEHFSQLPANGSIPWENYTRDFPFHDDLREPVLFNTQSVSNTPFSFHSPSSFEFNRPSNHALDGGLASEIFTPGGLAWRNQFGDDGVELLSSPNILNEPESQVDNIPSRVSPTNVGYSQITAPIPEDDVFTIKGEIDLSFIDYFFRACHNTHFGKSTTKPIYGINYNYKITFTGLKNTSGYVIARNSSTGKTSKIYFNGLNFHWSDDAFFEDKDNKEIIEKAIYDAISKRVNKDIAQPLKNVFQELRDCYTSDGLNIEEAENVISQLSIYSDIPHVSSAIFGVEKDITDISYNKNRNYCFKQADDLIQLGEFEEAYSVLLPFYENTTDLGNFIDECKVTLEINKALFGDSFADGRELTNDDIRPISDILAALNEIEARTEKTRGMVESAVNNTYLFDEHRVKLEISEALFGDGDNLRPFSACLAALNEIETWTEKAKGMVNVKKAEVYHQMCDFQNAELFYAAARESKPLDMSLALNQAQCLASLYQFDEACKVAEPFSHKVGLRLGLDITEFTEGQVLFVPGNPILKLQSTIMRPGFGGEGQDKLVFMGVNGEIITILLTSDFLNNLPRDFWSLKAQGNLKEIAGEKSRYDPNISYYSEEVAEYVNQFIIAAGGVPMRSGDNGATIVAIREQQYQLQAQHIETLYSHLFAITQKAANYSDIKKIQQIEWALSTTNQLFPSALSFPTISSWSGWKNMSSEAKIAWKNQFRLNLMPWLNFKKDKTQAILGTLSFSVRAGNILYANMLRQRLSESRRPHADMAIQSTSLVLQFGMTLKSGCNIVMKNASSDWSSFISAAPRTGFSVCDYYYESQGRASENAGYFDTQRAVLGLASGIGTLLIPVTAPLWWTAAGLVSSGALLCKMMFHDGKLEEAYSGVLKNIDYLRRESLHIEIIEINTTTNHKPNRYSFYYMENYTSPHPWRHHGRIAKAHKGWIVVYHDKYNKQQDSYSLSLMGEFPDILRVILSDKKPNALTEQDREKIENLVTIHHQNQVRTECLRKINAVIAQYFIPSNGNDIDGQSFALRQSLYQKVIPFGSEIIHAAAPQNSSYTFYQTNPRDTHVIGQLKHTLWMLQAEKALSRKDDVAYLAITKIFKSDNIFKFTHMDCAIELYSNFILCRLESLAKLGEGNKFFEEIMTHCVYLWTKLEADGHEKFTKEFKKRYKQCIHLLIQKTQEWFNGEDLALKEKAKIVAIKIFDKLWQNEHYFNLFQLVDVLSIPMQTLLAEILMGLKQDEGLAIFKDVPSEKQDDNYWASFARAYLRQSKINKSFKCISKITLLNENLEALSVLTGLLNRLIKNERRGNGKYYLLHYVLGYYVTAFSKHEDFNEIKNSHKNYIHELEKNACIIKDEGQRMYTKFREVSADLYQQLENGELVQAMNQIRLANMGLTTNTTKLPTHHTAEQQLRTMFFKYNSGARPFRSDSTNVRIHTPAVRTAVAKL